MSEQFFYLQDKRGFVGNAVLWWRKGGHGYTCDLTDAQVFAEHELERHLKSGSAYGLGVAI